MEDLTNWSAEQLQLLNAKAAGLFEPYLKNSGAPFIRGAITLVPQKINNPADLQDFKLATAQLIQQFPSVHHADKAIEREYQKSLGNYKQWLMKKYQIVPKGYYLAMWLPLGIAIGLPFGLIFKNIALGIPIGLGIGVAIGSSLDSKAKKENRQI